MDENLRQVLENQVRTCGSGYGADLAAAEAAVQRGQFNVAKAFRALGFAERVLAMQAARIIAAEDDPAYRLAAIASEINDDWPETELLFNRRVEAILGSHGRGTASLETSVAPWKLHEGKGYAQMPARAILHRVREVRSATLAVARGLAAEQWA